MNADTSVFDVIHKSATVVLAGCTLFTSYYIYKSNKNNLAVDKKKDRNIQSLKVLILDHNLKFLYYCFENLTTILDGFKAAGLSDAEKGSINDQVSDEFIALRIKFVDILLAVDEKLYNNILAQLDTFQDSLTEAVFDNGVNLSHVPKFDELITSKQAVLKTEIIKALFSYNG